MSRTAKYTVSVYLTLPIEDDEHDEEYTSQFAYAAIEKSVIRALGKLDGDADCEVMDVEIITEDKNPREKGDDDGVEYSDPRDEQEERRS